MQHIRVRSSLGAYYNEGRKRRRGAFGIVWRFGGIIQGYECPFV